MKEPRELALNPAQMAALARRLEQRCLEPADYEVLKVVLDTLGYLRHIVREKAHSIQRLLRMIFGARTEKTASAVPRPGPPASTGESAPEGKKKRKGHGRRPAAAYWGARHVHVAHSQLKPGDSCPGCQKGKLCDTNRPAVLLRLVAQPPITATSFAVQNLRCALCGKLYSATPPPEAGTGKFDPNVASMLAVLRYGYGLPTNRIDQMQQDWGIPLPSGTQWGLVHEHALECVPVLEEFERQAASGQVVHNDDTTARILELETQIRHEQTTAEDPDELRTGIFTTGIIAQVQEHTIALFKSGRQHAGENLQDVLDHRPADLPPPIQMSDGLSRNKPSTTPTIQANCNAHGRRGFVTVADDYPEECTAVLETMSQVYAFDAQARREAMSPQQRLLLHQTYSDPLLNGPGGLKAYLDHKFASRQVEPNSSLGKAISYILKRWEPLTLFLRKPGAPLDNNIDERLLKTAIRHRNNSLFYLTQNGARVGDLFMSLIATCRLAGANPFDYLCTLRRFAHRLRDGPADWMPWNYKATAAALDST
jgi:hypothetical protein